MTLTCLKRNIVAYDEDQSPNLEKALVLEDAISDLPPVIPLPILVLSYFLLELMFTKFVLQR